MHITAATLFSACLTVVAFAQSSSQPQGPAPTRQLVLDSLDRTLRRLDDSSAFHGVVLLAEGDGVIRHSAHGLAHKGYGVRNRPEMAFNMASVGKLYTAVSIGQLVAQGKLRWTDTLASVLPDFPDRDIARRITIEQLLSHRSGYGLYWERLFSGNWPAVRTSSDLLPFIKGDTLLFTPGTKWEYSNTGYAILGMVIERVSGQSYPAYVRDHILRPAGMDLNTFTPLDEDVPNRAMGYYREGDGPMRNNLFVHTVVGSGAGGGWASAPDLHKFARALQRGVLLDSTTLATMMTPRTDGTMGPWGYGYGFMTISARGRPVVGHTGGHYGIEAFFMMARDRGRVVIVLSNEPGVQMNRVVAVAQRFLITVD